MFIGKKIILLNIIFINIIQLHIVKNGLEESEIINILKETTKKQSSDDNFSETESQISSKFQFEDSIEKKEKFEKNTKDLLINLEHIESLCDEFLSVKSNYCRFIRNFLYNDSFGSIPQLKIELIHRFNCEEIKIPIKGSNKEIDA